MKVNRGLSGSLAVLFCILSFPFMLLWEVMKQNEKAHHRKWK